MSSPSPQMIILEIFLNPRSCGTSGSALSHSEQRAEILDRDVAAIDAIKQVFPQIV
jgi:hypothetical protein